MSNLLQKRCTVRVTVSSCVYLHGYVHACMRVHVHVCVCMWALMHSMHACIRVQALLELDILVYPYTTPHEVLACACTRARAHACIHAYVHAHMHACTHAHTHARMHAQAHAQMRTRMDTQAHSRAHNYAPLPSKCAAWRSRRRSASRNDATCCCMARTRRVLVQRGRHPYLVAAASLRHAV